jgi:gamma-glutamyl phosphate reductase
MEDILCLDGKLEVTQIRTGKQMLEMIDQTAHIPLIHTGSGPIATGTT